MLITLFYIVKGVSETKNKIHLQLMIAASVKVPLKDDADRNKKSTKKNQVKPFDRYKFYTLKIKQLCIIPSI